jgi:hypothetical protein
MRAKLTRYVDIDLPLVNGGSSEGVSRVSIIRTRRAAIEAEEPPASPPPFDVSQASSRPDASTPKRRRPRAAQPEGPAIIYMLTEEEIHDDFGRMNIRTKRVTNVPSYLKEDVV